MNATAAARHSLSHWVWLALVLALPGTLPSRALAQGEVNIYSYREPQLIDPLLKAFVDKTGIKTNIVYASAGLNERLAAEGHNSPADLLFTVDAGRLSEAKDAGLTQAVDSSVLQSAIPAQLRDPAGHWFGLTMRARIVSLGAFFAIAVITGAWAGQHRQRPVVVELFTSQGCSDCPAADRLVTEPDERLAVPADRPTPDQPEEPVGRTRGVRPDPACEPVVRERRDERRQRDREDDEARPQISPELAGALSRTDCLGETSTK